MPESVLRRLHEWLGFGLVELADILEETDHRLDANHDEGLCVQHRWLCKELGTQWQASVTVQHELAEGAM